MSEEREAIERVRAWAEEMRRCTVVSVSASTRLEVADVIDVLAAAQRTLDAERRAAITLESQAAEKRRADQAEYELAEERKRLATLDDCVLAVSRERDEARAEVGRLRVEWSGMDSAATSWEGRARQAERDLAEARAALAGVQEMHRALARYIGAPTGFMFERLETAWKDAGRPDGSPGLATTGGEREGRGVSSAGVEGEVFRPLRPGIVREDGTPPAESTERDAPTNHSGPAAERNERHADQDPDLRGRDLLAHARRGVRGAVPLPDEVAEGAGGVRGGAVGPDAPAESTEPPASEVGEYEERVREWREKYVPRIGGALYRGMPNGACNILDAIDARVRLERDRGSR